MIYFVRHGQTDCNLNKIIAGHYDIALNEKGMAQAKQTALDLQDVKFDLCFCSPLKRAQQTCAEILKYHQNLQPVADDRLKARDYGKMQQQPSSALNFNRWQLGEFDEESKALGIELIADFYAPFEEQLKNSKVTEVLCEKCGAPMIINSGKYGNYYACSNYPTCQNIKAANEKVVIPTDRICDKCGGIMVERDGKFGKFLACSNYPKCKNTISMTESVGVCPSCGRPTKKMTSRGGKVFYGCSGYPECNFMSWDIPTGEKCPECGKYLIKVEGKVKCSGKKCEYEKG